MEVEEYARIADAEDDHWWYRNTRAVMADLLGERLATDQRILDAGCGPGGNGAWLADHGQVVGVDLSADALAFVRARRPETVPTRASLVDLPFSTGAFDVAVAITVVYSVPDDRAAVRELARVVRPGGTVLLMEPAFESLRRAHDKTVHGVHRYRRAQLTTLVEAAGCSVERSTYLYSFLAPPAAALALAERVRPHATTDAGSDVDKRTLDPLFARIARHERRWLRDHDVAVGTTLAVVATRNGEPRSDQAGNRSS